MADRTCSIDGCDRPHQARGWCVKHYYRFRSTGNPLGLRERPAKPAECSVDGCRKPVLFKGLCSGHYARNRRTGSPIPPDRDAARRRNFWLRVRKDGPLVAARPDLGPCWVWTGGKNSRGYGVTSVNGKAAAAHRFAYQASVGPIPDGLDLDQLCHSLDESCAGGDGCPHRACVNPAHLEPVTPGENIRRGRSQFGVNFRKTHCKRGHEFTPENTIINKVGARVCRACLALRNPKKTGPRKIVLRAQCQRGHPFDAENTGYRKDGVRFCITCARASWARAIAKRKLAKKAAQLHQLDGMTSA